MKKLMLLGIVGSMFVIGQSLVFANGTGVEEGIKFTKSTVAAEKGVEEDNTENGKLRLELDTVASTEAITVVEAESITLEETEASKITEEKAMEFAEILGLDSKEIQKLSMIEFLGSLSDEDFDKLVDAGAIEMMYATSVKDGKAVETTNK